MWVGGGRTPLTWATCLSKDPSASLNPLSYQSNPASAHAPFLKQLNVPFILIIVFRKLNRLIAPIMYL